MPPHRYSVTLGVLLSSGKTTFGSSYGAGILLASITGNLNENIVKEMEMDSRTNSVLRENIKIVVEGIITLRRENNEIEGCGRGNKKIEGKY